MLRTLLVVACATFGGALPMSYRHRAVKETLNEKLARSESTHERALAKIDELAMKVDEVNRPPARPPAIARPHRRPPSPAPAVRHRRPVEPRRRRRPRHRLRPQANDAQSLAQTTTDFEKERGEVLHVRIRGDGGRGARGPARSVRAQQKLDPHWERGDAVQPGVSRIQADRGRLPGGSNRAFFGQNVMHEARRENPTDFVFGPITL